MKNAILLLNILAYCTPIIFSIAILTLFGVGSICASWQIASKRWKELGDLLESAKAEDKANFIILGRYLTFTILGFLAVISLVIIGIIILAIHSSSIGN